MVVYKVGRCAMYSNLSYTQSVSNVAGTNLYNDLYESTPIGDEGVKIFFPLDPPESFEIKGPAPVTSKHDQRGDTDCEHFNIDGAVTCIDSKYEDKWITYRFKNHDRYDPFVSVRYNEIVDSTTSTFPAKAVWQWFIPLPDMSTTCLYRFKQKSIFTPFVYSRRVYTGVSVRWHSAKDKYNYYCFLSEDINENGKTTSYYEWFRLDPTFRDTYPMRWLSTTKPNLPRNPKWSYVTQRYFQIKDLSSEYSGLSFDKIRAYVPRHAINKDYGLLCHKAFSDTKILSNNTLMYLSKLFTLPSSGFTAISDMVKDPTLAHAASAFLMYDYGIRLSVNQTISVKSSLSNFVKKEPRAELLLSSNLDFASLREIIDSMIMTHPNGHDFLTCRAMSQKAIVDYGKLGLEEQLFFKAYYSPYDNAFSKCYTVLNSLNLGLSAENIWDAIPYSFVVDWFISIGDYLSSVDTVNYIYTLDILGCIMTQVCDFRNFSLSFIKVNKNNSFTGDVKLRYYLRLRDNRIPNPISPPEISPKITFRHAVEGASLLLQRTQ